MKRILLIAAMAVMLVGRADAAEHGTPTAPAHGTTAAPHDDAAAPHGAGEHPHPPLLPATLDEAVDHTLVPAIWTVIIFLIVLAILYKTAWQQILAGLKKREDRIRADIADAEASRKRAEETLVQYNQQLATAEGQVRDILAKAATDAERIGTSMKMQAQQEVEEIKERATRDLEAARKAAIADIYTQAAEISTSIAEKIIRRNLNANDQRDLVNQSLEQLQSAGKV